MRKRSLRMGTPSFLVALAVTTIMGGNAFAQVCVAPPSNMVAWWPGDGNANDIAGANHGTLQNGATFAAGLVGQSFTLNSGGQYLSVPNSPTLHLGINQTLDAWVFPTANPSGNYAPLLAKKEVGFPGVRPYGLWMSPSGAFLYQIIVGGSSCFSTPEQNPGCCNLEVGAIAVNTWTHLAATYDGATQKVYMNGALMGSRACTLVPPSTPDPLWIGYDLTHTQFFGKIDEIELFNRTLSASEVQAIFDAGIAGKCKAITAFIDIKPGSFPNSINLGSAGTVPVAIFSTPTFAATTVDPVTITLASAPVKLKGNGIAMASFEDVNQDGLADILVHVTTQALQLSETDIVAVLEGRMFNGTPIRGSDTIRVVP
jgi:hypothetical protein